MNRQTGFTLLELMIVVAIAGILLAVGVPSFRTITENNRLATQANELVTLFNTARSEAVKRGENVLACALDEDWEKGIEVRLGNCEGVLLRMAEWEHGDVFAAKLSEPQLTFNGLGAIEENRNEISDYFKLAIEGRESRVVCINQMGRVRADKAENCGGS